VADNHVVQHPHVHQSQRGFKTLREIDVRVAGLGHAGWVVVGQDDGGGVVVQGATDDFPG